MPQTIAPAYSSRRNPIMPIETHEIHYFNGSVQYFIGRVFAAAEGGYLAATAHRALGHSMPLQDAKDWVIGCHITANGSVS
jgi:hypothetical protein